MTNQITQKKKVLIDLDVITVSIWDKKGENNKIANQFIERIEKKEFFIITPFSLLELVAQWKHISLKDDIEEFYIKQSDKILSNNDIDEKIKSSEIDDIKILKELQETGVKEEDALLVLITSIFDIDYLVTFNRIHLKNKKETINEVLKKNDIRTIKIVGPEEI